MFTLFNLQTITIYLSFYVYIYCEILPATLSHHRRLFSAPTCAHVRVHVFVCPLPLYRLRSQLSPIHAHAQHALSVSFILAYKKIKAILSLFRNASSSRRGASSERERTIATLQHGDLLACLLECVCV